MTVLTDHIESNIGSDLSRSEYVPCTSGRGKVYIAC